VATSADTKELIDAASRYIDGRLVFADLYELALDLVMGDDDSAIDLAAAIIATESEIRDNDAASVALRRRRAIASVLRGVTGPI
jgi:hypothetical protein